MNWFHLLAASTLLFGSFASGKPQEWPKWRGPNGDGISTEPIADKWPDSGPRNVWQQKVGLGYASPIAWDGKVYLFSQSGKLDTLAAFDAETGKPIWNQSYTVTVAADLGQAKNEANGLPLPLATPTIDGSRIYSYGGGGDLVCRNLADGSEVWHLNVLKSTGAQILSWNQSSSPLVDEKHVVVQGGKGGPTAIAVDKDTGKIAWQSQARTIGGYAAPILIDVDGTPQLIVFGGSQLYGMNPSTGATIWGLPWKTNYDVNAATPIYHDHHLFVSSDYGHGSMMLTVAAKGATEDWKHDDTDLQLRFQPAILDREYLYANSAGVLKCVHWPDGAVAWENKLNLQQGGTLVRDGDLLITLSERGKLSLIHATPQGATVLSQVQLFDFGSTWSTPLIYRGKLYAMGKDTLVCLDIASRSAMGDRVPDSSVAMAK